MIDNMSHEIIEAICENEDEEYVKDSLLYLYHVTSDKKLIILIEDWFDEHDYCVDCGNELIVKEHQEYRDGFGGCYETIYEKICKNCG